MKKGKIIIIVAPSGTGKTSLIQKLLDVFPEIEWSVSYTSRAPREGEVHGRDYFFISEEEFKNKIEKGDFAEWALVHGDYKGTDKSFVESKRNEGVSILFDVDVQGVDLLKKSYGEEAKAIFIEPPSLEELRRRLEKRRTDSSEAIEKRLNNAVGELERKHDFDFLMMNDNLLDAQNKLCEIVSNILENE